MQSLIQQPNLPKMDRHSIGSSTSLLPSEEKRQRVMMPLTELSATAQREIAQMVQETVAQRKRTDRHIGQASIFFTIAMILWVVLTAYLQQRTENRIGEALPPVVNLAVVPAFENPIVCPGDPVPYHFHVEILRDVVVDIDSVVRNLDTTRTEITSRTVRNIYDQGTLDIPSSWTLPLLLPATNSLPERAWKPGNYERILAITGVEGSRKASVAHTRFRVGANCPGVVTK